jgi:hydroxymethylpyrimidine pyrophosphatase-like HAD family hydrolase
MRYLALVSDYDGTLAHHGEVAAPTVDVMKRLLASGRRILLVTGRELPDLARVFPDLDLFARVVAENGALVHDPKTGESRRLADPPPESFVTALRERGVSPLSVGEVIVATWSPNETAVLETIREQGLELQVVFNKGAVMVLPTGVNKATGMEAALRDIGLSRHNVVGIGDAENDHAFLAACECSVAVANALPALKELCDWVTTEHHGDGVIEVVEGLIDDDLASLEPQMRRHELRLEDSDEPEAVRVKPYGESLLVAGPSGSGKSTLVSGLLERLDEAKYQFVVADPEGDYAELEGAVTIGSPDAAPTIEQVLSVLENPDNDAVVQLLGLPLEERPSFFQALLPELQEMRSRTGRPHWIVVDEAHHMLSAVWEPAALTMPQTLKGLVLITVHPDRLAPAVLASVDHVFAVGPEPERTVSSFASTLGLAVPPVSPFEPDAPALSWRPASEASPRRFAYLPARSERRRHLRKYAEGELGEDKSFYFRGPESKLNLRAQNLVMFAQLAEGVDDDTWLHHLHGGDYSRWFDEAIKDEELARIAREAERAHSKDAAASRKLILEAIRRRYTAPAA